MQMLGTQGKVALETDDEWELIIPHDLLSKLSYTEHKVAHFKRHPGLPVTHRWRQTLSLQSQFSVVAGWSEHARPTIECHALKARPRRE
eukprot:6045717-Amphidinium_carterae.1